MFLESRRKHLMQLQLLCSTPLSHLDKLLTGSGGRWSLTLLPFSSLPSPYHSSSLRKAKSARLSSSMVSYRSVVNRPGELQASNPRRHHSGLCTLPEESLARLGRGMHLVTSLEKLPLRLRFSSTHLLCRTRRCRVHPSYLLHYIGPVMWWCPVGTDDSALSLR